MAKSKDKETAAVKIRYGGFLTQTERNTPGAHYSFNWSEVTDEADLKNRDKPEKVEETAAPEPETKTENL